MDRSTLPVAVIGAGPVGLAAAVRLLDEGHAPIVFEAGARVGASILEWGHVRLFSPWKYNVDELSRALLESSGWQMPDGERFHTGREFVEGYLQPLAKLPQIAPHIHLNTTVTAITREQRDKMKTAGRENAPFVVRYIDADGNESEIRAKAIIDASGTCNHPNPLGAGGIKAIGEAAAATWISYGIPDVAGARRTEFAGKRVLVIGSGHSAFNVLLDLVQLKQEEPSTEILWAVRSPAGQISYGGGENDQLPARGQLGR
ncbi:MAG: NAD(P)-binding domain-containing protein, partial [Chloroflexota bacterium]